MCRSSETEELKLWAKMPQYKSKVKKTKGLIAQMLNVVSSPYISLSCGKDSCAMASLISEQKPVPMRFVSRGETRLLYSNLDEVLGYFKSLAPVEEICFDRLFSQEWKDADFQTQQTAGKTDIRGLDNSGFDGVFMGLRMDESRGRKISLKYHQSKGLPHYCWKYSDRQFIRMCPMAEWSAKDIGAYITEHNIPVLDWYKNMGFDSRTATRLNRQAIENNTVFWLHIHNPEGYHRLIERFPELKIY